MISRNGGFRDQAGGFLASMGKGPSFGDIHSEGVGKKSRRCH